MMDKSPLEKRIMAVNVSCALFSLFDLLTLDDGSDTLSRYVGNNLPPYAA
jgi:hypothetical protein